MEPGRLYVEPGTHSRYRSTGGLLEGISVSTEPKSLARNEHVAAGADAACRPPPEAYYGRWARKLEIEPRFDFERGLRLFKMALPPKIAGMMV